MDASSLPAAQATHRSYTPAVAREAVPIELLLERGLEYVQQKHYAEGTALLALVRKHLTKDQGELTLVLDRYIQEYAEYQRAQQALYEISARFAQVRAELQARTAEFSTLLPALLTSANTTDSSQYFTVPRFSSEDLPGISTPDSKASADGKTALPALHFTCFGPFQVRRNEALITLCSNRNGQIILRYLVAQPTHSAQVDKLMNILWPDDDTEVALRKLQVTVSILRRSLNTGYNCDSGEGYILYKQQVYLFNPTIPLYTDFDQFLELYEAGCKSSAELTISFFERACRLYSRPFLLEDLYADWSFMRREQLRQVHLRMCSALAEHYLETRAYDKAAQWATTIIEENRCDEAASRLLMRAYALEGRRSEALREYQHCQEVLFTELGMQPMPETVKLYQAITSGDITQ